MSEEETAAMVKVEEGQPNAQPAAESRDRPRRTSLEIILDPELMLHSQALAHDRNHLAEHRVIEEVLSDVTMLFKREAQTPSGKGASKVAAERKRVIKEMGQLVTAMDANHVVLDMPVDATDDIDALTQHLVAEVHAQGGLTKEQLDSVNKSIDAHEQEGKYHRPAMAHRLAVPLIYADIKQGGAKADTIVAFGRLASATHVGESDHEAVPVFTSLSLSLSLSL